MLQTLKKINWINQTSDKTTFDGLPVAYGFCGVNQIPQQNLNALQQEHGTQFHEIADSNLSPFRSEARLKGDGIFTLQQQIPIAVKTADCLPVLLASEKGEVVMAIHAGWKGLSKGIVQAGLESMRKKLQTLNSKSSIHAVLGPSIGLLRYEVGEEVVQAFEQPHLALEEKELAFCLYKSHLDKWHFDLTQAAVFMLLKNNIAPAHITAIRSCTFDHPDLWYSFRRDKTVENSIFSWVAKL